MSDKSLSNGFGYAHAGQKGRGSPEKYGNKQETDSKCMASNTGEMRPWGWQQSVSLQGLTLGFDLSLANGGRWCRT